MEEPFNQRTDLIGRSEPTPSSVSAQAIGQRATLPGECLEGDTGVEAKEVVNDTALLDHMGLGGTSLGCVKV